MAGKNIVKGRKGYEESVSTFLRSLTLSSPQSAEPTGVDRRRAKGYANALPPQDKSHSAFVQDQRTYEEEVRSDESFTGLPLHEKPTALASDRQYEVDGNNTNYESLSEETRCNSLPATVVALEGADEQRSPTSEYRAQTAEISEPLADSNSSEPADSVESRTDGSSGGSSLPWEPNLPKLQSIMPSYSSSDSNGPISDQSNPDTSDSEPVVDMNRMGVRRINSRSTSLDVAEVEITMAHVKESLQGFLYGSPRELETYLTEIVSNQRDFGFYVTNKLKPTCVDKVMCYRLGHEYRFRPTTPPQQDKKSGVFLCEDVRTKHPFILKKILKKSVGQRRLIGIEFLTNHSREFLPQIYGVYKDKDVFYIFEEYIAGGTLLHTTWDLAQVRQLAHMLLCAVHYLHANDLVHSDIKLQNLMVRNRSDPESLVLIDFESAKHPMYPLHEGGHTLTYLPPWHEQLMKLEHYNQVLKTMDLWAVACVIIFFLIPSARDDLEKNERGVWSQVMRSIRQVCSVCSVDHAGQYCSACRKKFLGYLRDNGHNILRHHLGHLMDAEIEDHNWKCLLQVLKYLTDTKNIKEKHISIALSLIRGPAFQQPAIEFDYDVNC